MANRRQVRLATARDVTEVRHFRGLDDEILREMRLIPSHDLPRVDELEELEDLLARLKSTTTVEYDVKSTTTVVYGVDNIRLFNRTNHETARFRFPRQHISVQENEKRVINENHSMRKEVIQALTDGTSTVVTVSFIPGGVDHYHLTGNLLSENWQKELHQFCEALVTETCRNSHLRHVHFDSKLCAGWGLDIKHLLQSSLKEISLPNLEERWWRDFGARLAENQRLHVVTVPYDSKKMKAFLQIPSSIGREPIPESWTTCNQTMKTLCITLPINFKADVQAHAEEMASTLYRAKSVSDFVVEYPPRERPPELSTFAACLRQALVQAPNVSVLHLLVPFRSQELRDHILSMRGLTSLILVSDFWGRKDLKAAKIMIRDSPKLEGFGLRRQNPKRKMSFLKRRVLFEEITTADIATFLGHDRGDNTRLQILSLRGWDLVDGETISAALDDRRKAHPNLYIDLTGTGLQLKNKHTALVVPQVSSESVRSTTTGSSSSPSTSQAGNDGSVYLSAVSRMARTSGSSRHDRRNEIVEHDELGSHLHAGPGSVSEATLDQNPRRQQQQDQQHPGRQPSPPVHFSIFSFNQLQEATYNFSPDAVIGKGGFGQVQSN